MWISKTKVPDVHGYIGFWMLLEALITDGWCVMVCANGFLSGRVGDSLSTSSAYISISQTLHGTAIYADQLGWCQGVNGAAVLWQSHGSCLGIIPQQLTNSAFPMPGAASKIGHVSHMYMPTTPVEPPGTTRNTCLFVGSVSPHLQGANERICHSLRVPFRRRGLRASFPFPLPPPSHPTQPPRLPVHRRPA